MSVLLPVVDIRAIPLGNISSIDGNRTTKCGPVLMNCHTIAYFALRLVDKWSYPK